MSERERESAPFCTVFVSALALIKNHCYFFFFGDLKNPFFTGFLLEEMVADNCLNWPLPLTTILKKTKKL